MHRYRLLIGELPTDFVHRTHGILRTIDRNQHAGHYDLKTEWLKIEKPSRAQMRESSSNPRMARADRCACRIDAHLSNIREIQDIVCALSQGTALASLAVG
jgi:hypothetical protein